MVTLRWQSATEGQVVSGVRTDVAGDRPRGGALPRVGGRASPGAQVRTPPGSGARVLGGVWVTRKRQSTDN